MLNEAERRILNIVQNDLDLYAVVGSLGKQALVEYYGYVLPLATSASPLVAGVTQTGLLPIQADAFFVLQYLSLGVVLPAGSTFGGAQVVTPASDVLVQITDTGSGHELFNQAIPGALIAGSPGLGGGGIPLVYSIPRVIPPNTNIKIEATQIGTTALTNPQPARFWAMLNGAKVSFF